MDNLLSLAILSLCFFLFFLYLPNSVWSFWLNSFTLQGQWLYLHGHGGWLHASPGCWWYWGAMTEVKGINSSQCVGDVGSHDESEGINSNQYVGGIVGAWQKWRGSNIEKQSHCWPVYFPIKQFPLKPVMIRQAKGTATWGRDRESVSIPTHCASVSPLCCYT